MGVIYAAFDTETFSLNDRRPENLAQFSMVLEEPSKTKDMPVWELPHFTCVIRKEIIGGDVGAIAMNGWVIDMMNAANRNKPTKYPVMTLDQLVVGVLAWFKRNGANNYNCHPLGQNVGTFDLKFCPPEIVKAMHYRSVEVSSVFMDPLKGPEGLGSVKTGLGFDKLVSHNAYHEAMDYILCLRTKYDGNITPYSRDL